MGSRNMISVSQEVDESIDRISVMLQQESSTYTSCYDYLTDIHDQTSSENSNEHVNESWRRKICEWSYEVVDHFGFDREVVSIALNYLDRVIASKTRNTGASVPRKEFQLAAVTTLYLAIKLHGETDAREGAPRKLRINAFVELSRGLFSVETIETTERSILKHSNGESTLQLLLHSLHRFFASFRRLSSTNPSMDLLQVPSLRWPDTLRNYPFVFPLSPFNSSPPRLPMRLSYAPSTRSETRCPFPMKSELHFSTLLLELRH